MATVGPVVSVKVTVRVLLLLFPAASHAVTVRRLVPGRSAMPLADQVVVPVAVPLPPRSFIQVTWVTPTLSDAVPLRVSEGNPVLSVGFEVGKVMATLGGVRST